MENTRKVAIILVNAETALDLESCRQMQSPRFAAALSAATPVPLQRYSFETVDLLKDRLAEWQRESCAEACGRAAGPGKAASGKTAGAECKGVDFHFIEVNFSEHTDPQERDYLKRLPASFVLSDKSVDRLIAAGRLVLKNNSECQRLLPEAAH